MPDIERPFHRRCESLQRPHRRRAYRDRRQYPPNGESLKGTCERTIPYYKKHILKDLQDGKTVLVSAHGNSLRSITMYVENISEKEIPNVEIPTGVPIVYTFDIELNLIDKNFYNP